MTGHELAIISARAYECSDFSCKDGTQGIVLGNTIAFRGTQFDHEDILKDLRAFPHSAYGTFVHGGFLSGARSAWEFVEPHLTNDTILTGHSLGGGLARTIALIMQSKGMKPPRVVTFGEPRSCFKPPVVAKYSIRYIHGNDCVPSHPWALWGYRHDDTNLNIGVYNDRLLDHKIGHYIRVLGSPVTA